MTIVTEPYPPGQAVPTLSGFHHLGLTVRDIEVSEAWYTKVLGLVRAFVEPHPTGDGYAVVMTRPGTSLFLGRSSLIGQPNAVSSEERCEFRRRSASG